MDKAIDSTGFGYIVVAGDRYEHDVVLSPKGKVSKRNKKLSKSVTGTGHVVACDEVAAYLDGKECSLFVVGAGQNGVLSLSDEARAYLDKRGIPYRVEQTPKAIETFNKAAGERRALIHVTC